MEATMKLAETLMQAVEKNDLPMITKLLKRRVFDMSVEEMDELLLQLPETSLSSGGVEEFLSPRALLCLAAKKGEDAKVNWRLELKASSFASAAYVAAQHGHSSLAEKLFERSCQTVDKLWDSGVVLPLLYDTFQESFQRNTSSTSPITMLNCHSATGRQMVLAFMHFAAKTKDVDTLSHLIDTWGTGHVNSAHLGDCTNSTLLHRASHYGHVEVVKLLLNKDARLDVLDHTGRTPLHIATIQGHLPVVEILLEHNQGKKIVNHQDRGGMTPLHLAACGGHVSVVRALLHAGAKPEISANREGVSIKIYSLFLGTLLESCRGLENKDQAQNGCFRLNPVMSMFWNPGGFSTLHFAVVYGGQEVTTELLTNECVEDGGRNQMVGAKDTQGLTAYHWAEARSSLKESAEVFYCLGKAVSHECNFSKDKAKGLMRNCKKMEKMKKEVEWAERIGWALRNGQWVAAQSLAEEACQENMNVRQMAWEHLEWASKGDGAIQEDWKSDKRKCLKPRDIMWKEKVEEVMLIVFKSNASTGKSNASTHMFKREASIDKVVLQDCLMWSMKNEMVDLAIEVASHKDCDLMEVTHGCCSGGRDTPLEFAASKHKGQVRGPWALRPVLQVMEQREDVRSRIYEDRQLFVDFLNAILVASVLIAGLAFQSLLQPPESLKAFRESGWDKPLAKFFGWSNHISFYFAIIATFAGICGAIPSPPGKLAYSKKKIKKSAITSTVFITAAVICHTCAFTAAALDLLKIHSKIRHELKLFSIICACASSIVLLWLLSRLVQIWEPIHKILQWGREYRNTICILVLIDTYLGYLHEKIIPRSYRQNVSDYLVDHAYNLCEGDTQMLHDRKHLWKNIRP